MECPDINITRCNLLSSEVMMMPISLPTRFFLSGGHLEKVTPARRFFIRRARAGADVVCAKAGTAATGSFDFLFE